MSDILAQSHHFFLMGYNVKETHKFKALQRPWISVAPSSKCKEFLAGWSGHEREVLRIPTLCDLAWRELSQDSCDHISRVTCELTEKKNIIYLNLVMEEHTM